jgi:3-oxoacyl-[acyl-carrier protein] reductase
MKRLTGKVAVVTGASKGIGAAIAEGLAQEGASVVVNYARSKADADKVLENIEAAGGKAIAVQADVSNSADVTSLFAAAKEAFGHVDILVNNAGLYEFAALGEITEEHYRKQFDLNVFGLLRTTQEAVKHLGEAGGVVINLSSTVSLTPAPGGSVYSATKAAVDAITRSLALELGPRVRVVSIAPGFVVTEGTEEKGLAGSDFEKMASSRTPLGRSGKPDDIAKVAVFLASDDAGWITGEVIPAGGGIRL